MPEGAYYIIIPPSVLQDKRLSPLEKILYGEILVLSQDSGKCWAKNQYFAEKYDRSKNRVSAAISNLVKYGYITCNFEDKSNNRRILAPLDDQGVTHTENGEGSPIGTPSRIENGEALPEEIGQSLTENGEATHTENDEACAKPHRKQCDTLTENDEAPTPKTVRPQNNINIIIQENNKGQFSERIEKYSANDEVRQALYGFLEMRKQKEKPPTERAFEQILKKLDEYVIDVQAKDRYRIECLDASTMNNWTGIFKLKDFTDDSPIPPTTHYPTPEDDAAFKQEINSIDDVC